MRSEFETAIRQLITEKGLPQEVVMEAVATALLSAYRKSAGGGENIHIEVDKNGQVKVWVAKRIVAQVSNPNEEISLAEAQRLKPHAALGETIEVNSPYIFERIPAQTAKQIILQRIREAEQEQIFEQFKDKLYDLAIGTIVRRDEKQNLVLDLGKAEGLLPLSEQVATERYKVGQRLRVYIYDIRRSAGHGVQVLVSRTHRDLVKRLFEIEVPEIYEGSVEIKAIAREAGSRSKVAVHSRQEGLDPIGSCVGVRGNRINNIVNELNGEKIDIIKWSPDPATFVANALSPVIPLKVELRESDHTALVTVPEKQLSLAIGRDGQNARLAARLTGWRVDVIKPGDQPRESADASRRHSGGQNHRAGSSQEPVTSDTVHTFDRKTALHLED